MRRHPASRVVRAGPDIVFDTNQRDLPKCDIGALVIAHLDPIPVRTSGEMGEESLAPLFGAFLQVRARSHRPGSAWSILLEPPEKH